MKGPAIWVLSIPIVWLGFGAASASGQQPVVIEDVIRQWEEQQERIKSVRVQWTETTRYAKGWVSKMMPTEMNNPPEDHTFSRSPELRIDGTRMYYRYQRKNWIGGTKNRFVEDEDTITFDGGMGKNFRTGADLAFPTGQQKSEDRHTEIGNMHLRPILAAIRPTDPNMSPYRGMTRKLTGRQIQIQGRPCAEIAVTVSGDSEHTVWVDLQREYSIVRIVSTRNGKTVWNVSIEHQHDSLYGWLPQKWSIVHTSPRDGSLRHSSEATATSWEINPRFRDGEFNLPFPAGTMVSEDDKGGTFFIAREDGSTRHVGRDELGKSYDELVRTSEPVRFSRPRTWLPYAAGAVLVVLSVLVALRLWKRSRSRST